jgi:hypothetical protein
MRPAGGDAGQGAGCRSAPAEFTDDSQYVAAFDRYEFLRSMLEIRYSQARRAALGEFVVRWGTSGFDVGEIDDQWLLVVVGGFDGDAEKAREFHVAVLQ